MPTSAGVSSRSTREITIDGGAYSVLAVHDRPRARPGDRQPARSLRFPRLPLRDLLRRHQQARLHALSRRRAHRRVLRDGADDGCDRPRGRARAVGGAARKPRAGPSRCRTTTSRTSTSTAATIRRACAWRARRSASTQWRARQKQRRARRPPHRHRLRDLHASSRRTAPACSRPGALPVIPGFDQATVRVTPDGGLEMRVGVHSHGQGMETTFAQIAHEILGIDIRRRSSWSTATPAQTPFSTGTYASRSHRDGGRRGVDRPARRWCRASSRSARTCCGAAPDAVALRRRPRRRPATAACSIARGRAAPGTCARTACRADVDPRGLEATVGYKPKVDTGAFSYATHAVAVAVDPEIGHVEILDYVIVEDCGTHGEPDGRRRPDLRRRRAGHRHRALRGDAVRRATASRWRRRSPTTCCPGATEVPNAAHLPHRDAVALHRVRHQGHGRRRRDRAAGGDLQCRQRCAARRSAPRSRRRR